MDQLPALYEIHGPDDVNAHVAFLIGKKTNFFERRWRDELWSGVESRWIRRFVATATIYSLGRVWSKTCLYSFCTNYVFLMTRLWIITPFVYLLIRLMGRTTLTHVLQPLYPYNAVLTPLNASTANYTSNTTCNGWTDHPLGQIRCPNFIDRPTRRTDTPS